MTSKFIRSRKNNSELIPPSGSYAVTLIVAQSKIWNYFHWNQSIRENVLSLFGKYGLILRFSHLGNFFVLSWNSSLSVTTCR